MHFLVSFNKCRASTDQPGKKRMIREIILDTETTGLSVADGDRITEIGCVEIIDKKLTGLTYHTYVNPEREVSDRAVEISGLTYEFLKVYKPFKDVSREFLEFIRDDRLVIHNAPFDIGFLNYEFSVIELNSIDLSRVIDTLTMAREKYPGSPATLDALCRKFNIDRSMRTKHGALIDAKLLAKVYIEMSVEIVQKSIFAAENSRNDNDGNGLETRIIIPERSFPPTCEEVAAHRKFLSTINRPLWDKFDKS
ncbi:MAG: DNA polymerase III subunit epsilon [Holosporales bacterium]|jgi:DNA polymerase-3 subunit epsilon|nr:DNA polymerase III subunit epsilon [Holosporales bacterium]